MDRAAEIVQTEIQIIRQNFFQDMEVQQARLKVTDQDFKEKLAFKDNEIQKLEMKLRSNNDQFAYLQSEFEIELQQLNTKNEVLMQKI